MVGTFYRAASPEHEPFAKVGQVVDENTTIGVIEAMEDLQRDQGGEARHDREDPGRATPNRVPCRRPDVGHQTRLRKTRGKVWELEGDRARKGYCYV